MTARKTSFTVTFTIAAIVLFAIVVFFNAIVGSQTKARIDFTQDKIYTMSPAAKRILAQLKVPVHVKLYITKSSEMPTRLKSLERNITDKLEEYKAASGGKLTYTVSDPSQNEDLAQKLQAKGIRPFQENTIERDAIGLKMVYSAIEMSYKDKDPEIIPRVTPGALDILEYEICRRIIKLTRDKAPVLAIYSTKESLDPQMVQLYMQMGQQPPPPRDLYSKMPQIFQGQGYDARKVEISQESPIPDDATTLMILSPKNLTDRQRFEIAKFLHRGGQVFCAVQNHEYDYNPGRRGGFEISARSITTGLDPLLQQYGVRLSKGVFMDENLETLSVPRTQNLGGMRVQVAEPVQAPIQIRVSGDQFNQDLSVSSRLGKLLYLWGGRLVVDDSKLNSLKLSHETLFTSSDKSWEVDNDGGPLTQRDFTFDSANAHPRAPLAVMIHGEFPNPYEGQPIPSWGPSDSTTTGNAVSEKGKAGTLILVGCGKMFEDGYLQAGDYNNGLLALNGIDVLTLGEDLIKVRAKTTQQRVIREVSQQSKLFWRIFTTALIPLLVAIYGIARTVRRRRLQAAWLHTHTS
jgi:ABC-type uncharacterized transport system involved in gliding motility auxiliary subunit